jgi:hypothetical protein
MEEAERMFCILLKNTFKFKIIIFFIYEHSCDENSDLNFGRENEVKIKPERDDKDETVGVTLLDTKNNDFKRFFNDLVTNLMLSNLVINRNHAQ